MRISQTHPPKEDVKQHGSRLISVLQFQRFPMLLLLFHAGDTLYAIDTAQIVEIVPMVLLRKVPHVPASVVGVFNYHGSIVPVIDLSLLIQGTPCQPCYSTRIIIVNYRTKDNNAQRLGLMAERVTETIHRPEHNTQQLEQVSEMPYLGEMFMDEKGMIQRIHWEPLVAEAQQAALLAGGHIQTNGARSN